MELSSLDRIQSEAILLLCRDIYIPRLVCSYGDEVKDSDLEGNARSRLESLPLLYLTSSDLSIRVTSQKLALDCITVPRSRLERVRSAIEETVTTW